MTNLFENYGRLPFSLIKGENQNLWERLISQLQS